VSSSIYRRELDIETSASGKITTPGTLMVPVAKPELEPELEPETNPDPETEPEPPEKIVTQYDAKPSKKVFLNYVDAPCGSGKSYSAVKFISENLDRGNHLFLCKTLRFANEVKGMFEARGVADLHVVTSETIKTNETVTTVLLGLIRSLGDRSGHVVIATHEVTTHP
jgi:hypothetical protein